MAQDTLWINFIHTYYNYSVYSYIQIIYAIIYIYNFSCMYDNSAQNF